MKAKTKKDFRKAYLNGIASKELRTDVKKKVIYLPYNKVKGTRIDYNGRTIWSVKKLQEEFDFYVQTEIT